MADAIDMIRRCAAHQNTHAAAERLGLPPTINVTEDVVFKLVAVDPISAVKDIRGWRVEYIGFLPSRGRYFSHTFPTFDFSTTHKQLQLMLDRFENMVRRDHLKAQGDL